MEGNSKDIGRAIRAKLEGYEKTPSDATWDKIRADLALSRSQQKRYFAYWLKRTAPIVLIVLLAGGVWLYNAYSENKKPKSSGSPAVAGEVINGSTTRENNTETAVEDNGLAKDEQSVVGSGDGLTNNKNDDAISGKETVTSVNKKANSLLGKADKKTASGGTGGYAKSSVATASGSVNKATGKTLRTSSAKEKYGITGTYVTGYAARNGVTAKPVFSNGDSNDAVANARTAGKKSGKKKAQGKTAGSKSKIVKATEETGEGITEEVENSAATRKEIAAQNSQYNYRNNRANPIVAYICDTDSACVVKTHKDSIPKQNKSKSKDNQNGTAVNLDYKEFYAFAYAAPAEFMFKDGQSLIDARFNSNAADTKLSLGYGAYIGYRFSAKASLRAGVLFAKIEQETKNATATSGGGVADDFTGVDYNNGVSNQTLADAFGDSSFNLTQKTSLLEIPLEFEYRLTSGRFGLSALVGTSAISVGTNTLTAQGSTLSMNVGSVRMNDNISFSAGAGLQLYYAITPALQINAEPYFKYYINTFNKEPNKTNPFSVAVRAGLQYNFDLK
ncbi:hypothetical protein ACLI1A_18150 [Flavobacterium sp. RHBU_3]|uniref:hypothetical protein n=1 Tax=Flavobacterium sp. RHBU_3 TaxID=3391184 RepID=UPI0039847006